MTPVPLELPVHAAEAAMLAEFVLESTGGRPLRDPMRSRLNSRVKSAKFDSLRVYPGSLSADPVHPTAFLIAVDGLAHEPRPLLLRIAPSTAPASALYPNALLIGRMRAGAGLEVVVGAIPFGPDDHQTVARFAAQVDPAFRPRPAGSRGPFAVAAARPCEVTPGAFDAFRYLLVNRSVNFAAFAPAEYSPGALRDTETAAVWAAIRCGWREGFALEVEPGLGDLAAASAYTTFIAGPELQERIASVKTGTWKRFDPDPEHRRKTAALTEILNRTPPAGVCDAILDFTL